MCVGPCWKLWAELGLLVAVFFFNDTATTEIYTLSLHDALPISVKVIGTTAGAKNNVTSVVIAAQSGTGNRARATLIVEATP